MSAYSWVTDDLFDAALVAIVEELSAESLLAIPGVYEVLSEHLNNEVLTRLEGAREEEEE